MADLITEEQVKKALSTVMEPELKKDLITLDFIKDIRIDGDRVSFTIMLTTPACPMKDTMRADSEAAVKNHIPAVKDVDISFDSRVTKDNRIAEKLDVPIKNIVAVSSGKGGVGKSTVSANLALSLHEDGAKTGILDADIYGPNIPMMLGVSSLPETKDDKIVPAQAFGMQVMSMGFLIPAGEALVWRGPMLHGAIEQLFTEVLWDELDYLVVDLPPGTGDAQLSLAQLVPLTGGIVVTSPQAVSVSDARRGVSAFKKLDVPVLGVLENMSGDIFGRGGGRTVAEQMDVDFLGAIDLHPDIPQGTDEGTPFVVSHPSHPIAAELKRIARVIAGKISMLNYEG